MGKVNNKMNIFESRALQFIYCNSYVPEIDDKLSGNEWVKEKMMWSSPFDLIILPIGFWLLHKRYKKLVSETSKLKENVRTK